MPAAPFWEDTPDPWDVLVLGGLTVPGITTVTGRASRKMDTRSGPGSDGARVRDKGYEPAQVEARNRIWRADQLAALTTLLATINPRIVRAPQRSTSAARRELTARERELAQNPEAGNVFAFRERLRQLTAEVARLEAQPLPRPTRTPYDVVHPQLSLLGIRSVYVVGVTIPELQNGELVTTISMVEWTDVPAPAPRPSTASEGIEGLETAFEQSRSTNEPQPTPPGRIVGQTGRITGGGAGRLAGGGG